MTSKSPCVSQHIEELWKKLLLLQDIDPHVSFFSLGGDSLTAMHMLLELADQFGVTPDPDDFLAQPTVAGLSRMLDGLLRERRSWNV